MSYGQSNIKDLSAEELVNQAFWLDLEDYTYWDKWNPYARYYMERSDFVESVLRYPDPVFKALRNAKGMRKLHALTVLEMAKVPLDSFVEDIANLSVVGTSAVRSCAQQLIRCLPVDETAKYLGIKVCTGKPDERAMAASLICQVLHGDALDDMRARLLSECPADIRDDVNLLLGGSTQSEDSALQPSAISPLCPVAVLADSTAQSLRQAFCKYAAQLESLKACNPVLHRTLVPSVDWIDSLLDRVQGTSPEQGSISECIEQRIVLNKDVDKQQLVDWASNEDVQPIHAVRLLIMVDAFPMASAPKWWNRTFTNDFVSQFNGAHENVLDLRTIGAVFDVIGLDIDRIGKCWLTDHNQTPRLGIELVWPFFQEHPNLLHQAMTVWKNDPRAFEPVKNALQVIAAMPSIPKSLESPMWNLALESSKPDSIQARALIGTGDGKEDRIIEALSSERSEVRQSAAVWLSQIGYRPALPAIKATLQKETKKSVKEKMSAALQALSMEGSGVLADSSPESLLKAAQEALSDTNLADLSWFPFEQMPSVRWNETGESVPADILKWWIAAQHSRANPEPDGNLVTYIALIHPEDRPELGQFVFDAWITQDTLPKSSCDQDTGSTEPSASRWRWVPFFGKSNKAVNADPLPANNPGEVRGSAFRDRGILAITSACGGKQVALSAAAYMKKWYGYRAGQCKALLHMLSGMDDSAALQVVLSVATRFKTKGIQNEAMNCIQSLAARKGWSVDQLGDRTIPTAGFEDNGELVLDYGGRSFSARLNRSLDIVLHDSDGNTIKALPEPRRDDDAEKAKAAKQLLTGAKKELKSILSAQTVRLYDAMCTGREWSFEEWNAFWRKHPIAGRLCQGLVWIADDAGKGRYTLRPLEDGSITDMNDQELTLPASSMIKLAHSTNLHEDERTAWVQHIADYEVNPPFDQLSRPPFFLPADKRTESYLKEFEGFMVDPRKLRRQMEGWGCVHSQAEDGALFYNYTKRFGSIGIEAVFHFTGIIVMMDANEDPVAIRDLHFVGIATEGKDSHAGHGKLTLEEVPSALLDECWNQMSTLAAGGSGFDPNWRDKTAGRLD